VAAYCNYRPIEWCVGAVVLLCSVLPAGSDHRLDAEDVLEISVAGVPELKQRVTVGADGTISFPLLGVVTVAGLLPSEARSKIQSNLATKIFRQRAADGRETVVVIEVDQVTVSVAQFRPVFVNGDVSKSGQVPYHAAMTVREAVALAGGYEIMRFRMTNNPFLESADLRSEYEAKWAEYIREQARVWRLRAELGDDGNERLQAEGPISRSTISEIVRLEHEQLEVRQADHEREKAFIERTLRLASSQVAGLSEQQANEEQGLQTDIQELKKVTELYGKGSLPSPRVTDARRAVLLSATRKLQTAAQLMHIERQREDLSRQLQRLDDQRKINVLKELQDAQVKLNEIRSRLQSVTEKLYYTGIVKSQLVRGKGGKPEIVVIRKVGQTRERLDADEDFELQPGDFVEIALHEPLAGAPAP
jgi:polysaccharide export outer membrane protein